MGTPDANGAPANSTGYVKLATIVGDPGTPADEADMKFELSMTDVRRKTTGVPDYTGELGVGMSLVLTDRSGAGGTEATTVIENAFDWGVTCATTASTTVGSTCSGSTTADAVIPGMVDEGARAVWQLRAIDVGDGGPDGLIGTSPNGLFATQGIFVP